MAETEALPVQQPRKLHLDWVLPVLWRPRRILTMVSESTQPVWHTPLLILTIFALIHVFVAGPVQKQAALMNPVVPPADYQYWTPEQQAQYEETMAAKSGSLFVYGVPAVGALVKIWLGWLIFAGILHLVMTLSGGRYGFGAVMNVVAWASVPILIRYGVQIISMLSTHRLITSPGLLGFAPVEPAGVVRFLAAALPYIDLYFFWQIVLIVVGLRTLPGLASGKIWTSVLIAAVLLLALMALPGFLGSQFGGLSLNRPFYF